MGWLRWIQYLPLILQVVTQVETLTGAGKGEEKKKAAVALTKDVLGMAGVSVKPDLEEGISHLVDRTVAVLNSHGVFSKKTSKK